MFIDSHAHLFIKDFGEDLREVILRAADAGVEFIVNPGTDLESSREAIALAERFDSLYACVGFHPHEARKADGPSLDEIEKLSHHEKVVAIGEIGLDYHYDYSPRDIQREVFSLQIDIARERDLPVVIHSREAEGDTVALVEGKLREPRPWRAARAGAGEPALRPRGVFHCFPGDEEMARRVIGWGFYISIPGPVTFGSKQQRPNVMAEVVSKIPLEHILLETDSPYLSPVPLRGKRNEPANIPLIAHKIAELKGLPVEEIGRVTTLGARKLFGIGSEFTKRERVS
jgi:TatD DNase family protein